MHRSKGLGSSMRRIFANLCLLVNTLEMQLWMNVGMLGQLGLNSDGPLWSILSGSSLYNIFACSLLNSTPLAPSRVCGQGGPQVKQCPEQDPSFRETLNPFHSVVPTISIYPSNMVVSLNRGTPIWTPKYYSPYYKESQKGTPNFGKLPYLYDAPKRP